MNRRDERWGKETGEAAKLGRRGATAGDLMSEGAGKQESAAAGKQ